eukprot:Gb_05709 [translate_table: standard]
MGKWKQSDIITSPKMIEIREHDNIAIRKEMKDMGNSDPIYIALENVYLQTFLSLLPFFYEERILSEVIVAVAQDPEKLYLSDEVIHRITGLPMTSPDLPKGAKLKREQVAQEYYENSEDLSKFGIEVEGLKD